MPLRDALHLLDDRLEGQYAVWLLGLAFGLVLGGSYALLFLVGSPVTNAVGYSLFVLLVAPLFGAALWPYVAGNPPDSVGRLVRGAIGRYPRLLAARVGYVLLLVGCAAAFVALVGTLATLASLGNYLTGGGATTMGSGAALETVAFAVLALAVVGASVGRVSFGFLDAAALRRGTVRGALDEALATAARAPGRVVAGATGLAVYRAVVPVVFGFFVATNVDTNDVVERLFATPQLAVLPADAPSYARPPDPALAPELLAGLVGLDVLVTAVVWPVAMGYHFALYETLRSTPVEGTAETSQSGAPDADAQ